MITSVYIDTDELVYQLHSVSDDAQKALEWVRAFRDTLMFGARIPNPLPFAMECMAMSEGFSASGVLGKLRASARKRLNDEGIEATPESIDAEITRTQGSDAVREIMAKIERANSLKAEIRRRKFTAAAATRDGADESTTGSSNMRRVPQNEAPAHVFSGGRTAQGTMSRSPEAAAQYGKDYDQGALDKQTISANSPAGAGVNLDSTQTIKRPDASSGNAEVVNANGSTITRNGSRAAFTSATSGQTIEALEQPRAGEVPPESVSAKPSPALPVPAKRPHGEFGNVMLTDDEFAKLQEKTPNAWDLITELDQYIESQGKTKKYKSHYATLLNWSRRKAQEAKPKQGYLTSDDISKKNYQESKARLEAMFSKGRETA